MSTEENKNVENTQSSENSEVIENNENIENTENTENTEKEENKRQRGDNKPKRQRKAINVGKVIIWGVGIGYVITQLVMIQKDTKPVDGELSYSQVFEMLDNEDVESVSIIKDSDLYKIHDKEGHTYTAVNPKSDGFVEKLMEHGANISVAKESKTTAIAGLLVSLPLILILIMMATYMASTVIGGSTKMFTLLKVGQNKTKFSDVKGHSETKKEISFAVDQLKNWKSLENLGARPCKGMLLYGPPGTGKTLMARAIASEAGVPFISASGSDFNEVFVGVGAGRVRTLFTLAAENAPCIVFIDEIDCLGKRRKGGDGASQDHNQTLNALLQRMDGLNKIKGVLVIGATNRKGDLDDALLRPGRFDRQYYMGPPKTKKDRDELVEYYLSDKKLAPNTNMEAVSKLCVGLTGAEIEEATNEAVYISLREKRKGVINVADVDEAIMKIRTAGVKQEHTSKRDAQITAVHEAGHTIVSLALNVPISNVSIVPYSTGMGGRTQRDLDEYETRQLEFKSDTEHDIMMLLAGMAAEDAMYGEHTQGCSSDLDTATRMIYSMLTQSGQGENLVNENTLMDLGISHLLTEKTVDECNKELNAYREKTNTILDEHWEYVTKLAARLLEEKTIVQPTFEKIAAYSDEKIEPIK